MITLVSRRAPPSGKNTNPASIAIMGRAVLTTSERLESTDFAVEVCVSVFDEAVIGGVLRDMGFLHLINIYSEYLREPE